MAKQIRLDESEIDAVIEQFRKELEKERTTTGKIAITKNLKSVNERATLYFTSDAFVKMQFIIQNNDKEVAWHGVASRVASERDESANVYLIEDILMYPQTVTGTTVDMDETEYANWLMDNIEDERFNHIRMQGHSHVNMAVSPSGTDIEHQEEILHQLSSDDFYIFMIWNKRSEKTISIYDMQKNVVFEKEDITMDILLNDGNFVSDFIADAKTYVKEPVRVWTKNRNKKGGEKQKDKISTNSPVLKRSTVWEDDDDDYQFPFDYEGYGSEDSKRASKYSSYYGGYFYY